MSELKFYVMPSEPNILGQLLGQTIVGQSYYLKSEADKVIAELEMKLARAQLVLRLNEPEALFSDLEIMGRLKHQIDVVERRERHQKYKRCLAMAMWCERQQILCYMSIILHRYDFYVKWHKRWLELAEKFKEVK